MKYFAFLSSLLLLVFCWVGSATAQGRAAGHTAAPSLSQGHGQTGATDHGKANSDTHGASGQDTKTNWETKFNERVQNDAVFRAKIQSLLPPNTDLKAAESGFKNHGQFIAALHVSHNLNIPFNQLKAKITGVTTTTAADGKTATTTTTPESLGKAIHDLRPDLSQSAANDAAKKAEKQTTQTEKPSTT